MESPAVSKIHFVRDDDGALTRPLVTEVSYLVMDLSERGIELSVDGSDIVIRPWKLLTERDREALRRLKPHVRAFLAYAPPGVH